MIENNDGKLVLAIKECGYEEFEDVLAVGKLKKMSSIQLHRLLHLLCYYIYEIESKIKG